MSTAIIVLLVLIIIFVIYLIVQGKILGNVFGGLKEGCCCGNGTVQAAEAPWDCPAGQNWVPNAPGGGCSQTACS